ncbi:hypothetical protein [Geomicrobium sp. JCM 19039]|uniref:hypothetical protein n=1 Tax=Geomicrobium sp. JCM 19039 TaxID=1460636 RepID=UPI00045F10C1|nr:hypothetical protein [Geomicrobium sp. JCM 19039]GAK11325.1 hypothetical protein JCM19039_1011 [Geomicrobium sp. JCM 19039]
MSKALHRIPITHIEQKVSSIEKHTEHFDTDMVLYEEKITIDNESFTIESVFDMSYRFKQGEIGFLYLHTSQGVRTFYIKEDPTSFIERFRTVERK